MVDAGKPQTLDDSAVRVAAFDWLTAQVSQHGDVLPRTLLAEGFRLAGRRVPLLGPQGIFKPAVLPELPLSITTVTQGPYSDRVEPDGVLLYNYRGKDPEHPDNRGLRAAMRKRVPLVFLHSILPGRYLAVWPVFVVGDDRRSLTFRVAFDDAAHAVPPSADTTAYPDAVESGRRAYITASVLVRVHQRSFRERVLRAYREQCAFCRLKHRELLDAAHIVGDRDELGEPLVRNGLSLCKLHHAAYDALFITLRPDYRIIVRPDLLAERDGPMLVHGLQGLHERKIELPSAKSNRPDTSLLEIRYNAFLTQPEAA